MWGKLSTFGQNLSEFTKEVIAPTTDDEDEEYDKGPSGSNKQIAESANIQDPTISTATNFEATDETEDDDNAEQIALLQNMYFDMKKLRESEKAKYEAEITSLHKQIDERDQQNMLISTEYKKLLQERDAELKTLKENVTQITKEKDDTVQRLEAVVAEKTRVLEATQSERDRLMQKINQLQSQIATLTAELKAEKNRTSTTQSSEPATTTATTAATATATATTATVETTAADTEVSNAEEEFLSRLSEVSENVTALISTHGIESQSAIVAQLQKFTDSLETQLQSLAENQRNSFESRLQKQRESSEATIGSLNQRIEALKATNESLAAAVTAFDWQPENVDESLDALQNELESALERYLKQRQQSKSTPSDSSTAESNQTPSEPTTAPESHDSAETETTVTTETESSPANDQSDEVTAAETALETTTSTTEPNTETLEANENESQQNADQSESNTETTEAEVQAPAADQQQQENTPEEPTPELAENKPNTPTESENNASTETETLRELFDCVTQIVERARQQLKSRLQQEQNRISQSVATTTATTTTTTTTATTTATATEATEATEATTEATADDTEIIPAADEIQSESSNQQQKVSESSETESTSIENATVANVTQLKTEIEAIVTKQLSALNDTTATKTRQLLDDFTGQCKAFVEQLNQRKTSDEAANSLALSTEKQQKDETETLNALAQFKALLTKQSKQSTTTTTEATPQSPNLSATPAPAPETTAAERVRELMTIYTQQLARIQESYKQIHTQLKTTTAQLQSLQQQHSSTSTQFQKLCASLSSLFTKHNVRIQQQPQTQQQSSAASSNVTLDQVLQTIDAEFAARTHLLNVTNTIKNLLVNSSSATSSTTTTAEAAASLMIGNAGSEDVVMKVLQVLNSAAELREVNSRFMVKLQQLEEARAQLINERDDAQLKAEKRIEQLEKEKIEVAKRAQEDDYQIRSELQEQIHELEEELSAKQLIVDRLSNDIQELNYTLQDMKLRYEDQINKLEKTSNQQKNEIDNLKRDNNSVQSKVVSLTHELEDMQSREESSKKIIETLNSHIQKHKLELDGKDAQIRTHETALSNLQSVLEQFQSEHESDTEHFEQQIAQLREQLTAASNEVGSLQEYKNRFHESEERSTQLENEIAEKSRIFDDARTQMKSMKALLNDTISRLNDENLIERRLVVKMLLKFLEARNKQPMTEKLAKTLRLTPAEKERLAFASLSGLASWLRGRPRTESNPLAGMLSPSKAASPADDKPLSSLWVEFLLREADAGAPNITREYAQQQQQRLQQDQQDLLLREMTSFYESQSQSPSANGNRALTPPAPIDFTESTAVTSASTSASVSTATSPVGLNALPLLSPLAGQSPSHSRESSIGGGSASESVSLSAAAAEQR